MAGYTHNYIPNGDLHWWDAGPVPHDMDVQTTQTTLFRMQRSNMMNPGLYDFLQTFNAVNWPQIMGRLDTYTYSGEDSLRVAIAAAGVADDFRIMPEGVAAVALTGASTRHVPVDNIVHPYAFTFAARCNVDGNLIRIRLVLRTAADAVAGYWNDATKQWQVAAATNDFAMTQLWRRYGVTTAEVPQAIGGNVVENMIWQVSNGTAGEQFIDLDDFQIYDLENSYGHL